MSKLISQELSANRVVFDANYLTGGIADRSPYKAAATVTAPVNWAQTRSGYAVTYGDSGLLSYADNAANRLAGSDATWIVLGKFERHQLNKRLICKRAAGIVSYDIYTHNSEANALAFYNVNTRKFSGASIVGRRLIAITLVNGNAPICYLDGTYASAADGTITIPSSVAAVSLGNYYNLLGNSGLNQPIQRVTILNRALSAKEIAQLFKELMAESYPTRAYHFGVRIPVPEDPPGCPSLLKTAFDRLHDGRVIDRSGNGYHGTVKPGFPAGPGMCGNALYANSASRTYVDFGDVTPINGAQKLSVIWYGKRGASNPGEVVLSKANNANARIAIWFNTASSIFSIGDGKGFGGVDANVGTPLCGGWVFDGSKVEAQRGQAYSDNAKLTTNVTAGTPDTLPNNAGISLEVGRMGYTTSLPPCDRFEGLAIYPTALTPEQYLYVYKQIARRSTFALDMQRVPVSLANMVGPCEVPGTPFRLAGGTWKVSEDSSGKRGFEVVATANVPIYMPSTKTHGTWVFDVYHTLAGERVDFISDTTNRASASRNMYSVGLQGAIAYLYKTVAGTMTNLTVNDSALVINTWYRFAVTRSSQGVFTTYIKGGVFKEFTLLTPTTGTNPVTDTAITSSKYFNFCSANETGKLGNINFFAGPFTADMLREYCPDDPAPIKQLELFAFTTTKQIPSFVTAFSSTDAHTFIWGDGTSDVLTSAGETKTHDYGGAGTRIIAFRVTDPTKLTTFHCFSNDLTGSIPGLSRFVNLQQFYGYLNSLSGRIPDLSKNTALLSFQCQSNQLTGGIPSLANNPLLQYFYCYSNPNLGGTIPSLANNPALRDFRAHSCNLTGNIPSLTANTALSYIHIAANNLTGSIPDLSANTQLTNAFFHQNQLSGVIPSLSANTKLTAFYCYINQLTGYTPSTLATTLVDFEVQTNALTQAAVDQILADFATNVAARPATGTIALNGNAKPSVAGLNSKTAILVAKPGWTITTTLKTLSFVTAKQNPSIITAFSQADAHSYIWGDGVTDTLTTTGETQTHDYGSPGQRILELSVPTPARLTAITFSENQLTGTFPDLSAYTGLTSITAFANSLTGALPNLSALTELQYFFVQSNGFTGSIPSIAANTKLLWFDVDFCQLTGSIPSLAANTLLQRFICYGNQLSGSIPSLTANTALQYFYCYNNQLTGYTASTLATTLTRFNASNNLLTQAAVDQILADFATNVAARPAAGTITLNGTGNAAPSAAGLASRAAILAAKPGWTILVNS